MNRFKTNVWVGVGLLGALILCCIYLFAYYHTEEVLVSEMNSGATAGKLRILKETWKENIKHEGAENAYARFLAEAPSLAISPHEQIHAFGEALYEIEGLGGLRACDASFEFGCYHSFFGVAVQKEGIGVLSQFDEACRKAYGTYNLPCEHGIGHGVLVYTDYENLTDALTLCETISSLPTGGCSSGVFMEYNFHTMDESDSSFLREPQENLYEPCDALPERFQASCYLEQVQWWENIFNADFSYIGTLCAGLPQNTAIFDACFHGIGNYLAASVDLDIQQTVAGCAQMPNPYAQALCHEGASWLVRADGSGMADAQKICEALPEIYAHTCSEKLGY